MRGLVAGAAGTVALDLTTYGDMFITGRGASSVPSEMTRRLAELFGCAELSTKEDQATPETKNRQAAVGAVLGMKVGLYVGVAASLSFTAIRTLPRWAQAAIIGATAMAASDIPMAKLQVSDPKTWSSVDWLRDAVPHFVYGYATAAVIDSIGSNKPLE